MIGIDTNVLVRYLTNDDPQQSELAARFLEQECTKETPGHINLIVLCELVWVLRGAYKADKETLIVVLKQILETTSLHVEKSALAWAALQDYEKGSADFSDYLIMHLNKHLGCSFTFTFDTKAGKHSPFKTLS